jgi:NitT/TauT family transport system substrate-binding protein
MTFMKSRYPIRQAHPPALTGSPQVRPTSVLRTAGSFLFLLAALSAGCSQAEGSLRVGANIWPGYEPLFLARSLGYYKDQPIKLVEFTSSTEVIRAYRNGLIEVAAFTLDEALLVFEKQPDHRIVLVCDFSDGADMILGRPDLRSIKDLKGKRVGGETTALGAYILSRALELNGMSAADISMVEVALPEHEKAYLSGRVDAIVTFAPHGARLLAAGARKLFDSSQIPGEIVDVMTTRRNLTEPQNRTLAVLVSGWFKALEYLRENPSDAAERMARRESLTAGQFLDGLQGIRLLDREVNRRLLGRSGNNLSAAVGKLSAIMRAKNLLTTIPEPPLLDDSFVKGETP